MPILNDVLGDHLYFFLIFDMSACDIYISLFLFKFLLINGKFVLNSFCIISIIFVNLYVLPDPILKTSE